jgi:hypothetical protein
VGYYPSVEDSSGNGNELSVWDSGGAGYLFTSNLGFTRINGLANNFSVRNNGPTPSMWTATTDPISSISPAAFTIEATFKLENGNYRTIVGRDSYGTASSDAALSALYSNALRLIRSLITYFSCDVSGYWHHEQSQPAGYSEYILDIRLMLHQISIGTVCTMVRRPVNSNGSTLSL